MGQVASLKVELFEKQAALSAATADLRGALDFMMRVNIEAAGGPSCHLSRYDFLPPEVIESLALSQHGRACVVDLHAKYEVCMAQYAPDHDEYRWPTNFPLNVSDPAPSGVPPSDAVSAAAQAPLLQPSSGADPLPRAAPVTAPPWSDAEHLAGPSATLPSPSRVDPLPRAASAAAPPAFERFHKPYRCIQALGARPPERGGLLSRTAQVLKAPVRDVVGFTRQPNCQALSRLSHDEREFGVWSEWVANYTCAGLRSSLEQSRPENTKQAVVLTCERLFLCDVTSWAVALEVDTRDIEEILLSSFSDTVVVLRLPRRSDIVLDLRARDRFIDELRLASRRPGQPGGGRDLKVSAAADPLVTLLDHRRSRTAQLAFVEHNVFLLLPYEPESFLLTGAETLFIGFLEVQSDDNSGAGWTRGGWNLFFFLLKGGQNRTERQLAWCHHPLDPRPAGHVPADSINGVHPADSMNGDNCIVIERRQTGFGAGKNLSTLTLRAPSARAREDWLIAVHMVCGQV